MALLQAAIEAADSDQAAVQAAFFAAAARGRPELPADAGHQVELSLRGNLYRMHVYCLGRGRYRVDAGDGVIDANVQHLGRYERAVTCFGRRHRVIAGVQGPRLIVEVDGVPHVITRHGGSHVRAPAPAFVVAVQVAQGDTVRAGDPLVVLESMKMETAITAPFPGTVHAVFASVNTHVEAGAPLVQLQPPDEPVLHAATGPRLRLAAAPDRLGPVTTAVSRPCAVTCSAMTSAMTMRASWAGGRRQRWTPSARPITACSAKIRSCWRYSLTSPR